MVIGRRVTRRKGQHVVALAPEVRDRLRVIPGQWLYFHLGRKGEVILSTSPARAGGQPPTASLERELEVARAQVADLTARLADASSAARRQSWYEVAHEKLRLELTGLPVMGAINTRLARMEDALANLQGSRFRRRQPTVPRSREVQVAAAPILQDQKSDLVTVGAATSPE